ncbi:hypothetical protein BDV95DRAFT_612756 [Massariosphaeria phaeospora]|uniref:Uncharacterized protein n=1 Tax=Massariosphaeria phaeospora TaxID=100035 RepID=A0A7C8I540_9PLEO|nr:hypothetical protein BDV95DRAFT_612756 [Massariosphaeria phaeospora]
MPSSIKVLVAGGALVGSVRSAVLRAPTPVITPAPKVTEIDGVVKRQDVNPIRLAAVLFTALPESLRDVVVTNLPAMSSVLDKQFLDNNKPDWFLDLPSDIQTYLVKQFGPETAWPTEAPTSSKGDASSSGTTSAVSATESSGSSIATSSPSASEESSASQTSASDPDSPPSSNSGLSKSSKVGLGVGIPLALLTVAAVALACCFLLRRRRRRHMNGTIPPSSPGFIPRFAFQEKSADRMDYRAPLNPDLEYSSRDMHQTNWDDDGIDPEDIAASPTNAINQRPVLAPVYHTHSSNRARGTRTSYTSLHSVAELSEPDDMHLPPVQSRHSPPRGLIPASLPTGAQVKRKPVPSVDYSPAAQAASQTLQRQTMPDHRNSGSTGFGSSYGSSSSGLISYTSTGSNLGNHTEITSQAAPVIDQPRSSNPFSNDHAYTEDYGPEYHHGYADAGNGTYGGHPSLSQYPTAPRSSKTEWPLQNTGTNHKRDKSPLWDRVYEG